MVVNLVSVTTINRKMLYQGQPGTSVATAYTVPTSTDVKITSLVLCNTTASPATVTVYVVPSGSTAGATNVVLSAASVGANSVVVIDAAMYMTTGDFIATLQGTSSAVTVSISGETYA